MEEQIEQRQQQCQQLENKLKDQINQLEAKLMKQLEAKLKEHSDELEAKLKDSSVESSDTEDTCHSIDDVDSSES